VTKRAAAAAVPDSSVDLARAERAMRQLELLVTRRLDGLLHGDHQGLVPGAGSEPGEARPYEPGDDVRRIDWNLSARMFDTHVRDDVADRELETWVLVDGSPSLDIGTADRRKRDVAVAAVAAVGFLAARPGNRFGAVVLDGAEPQVMPARTGVDAVRSVVRRLIVRPEGRAGQPTDLGIGLQAMLRPRRRRGLVAVVSDFLVEPGWEPALRALTGHHQVLAVHVVDPRDVDLPDVGFLTLVDPETGRLLDVQTARPRVRERFAHAAAEQQASIAASIRRAGAAHLVLRTDRDWVLDIARHVAATRRRRAAPSVAVGVR
jgi:uncharacterized protein (DUF58 family)